MTPFPGVAPLATDPRLRTQPHQQFNPLQGFGGTGFGTAADLLTQMGSMFLFGGQGMFPGGMGRRNLYDQLESYRLQQLKDSVGAQAAKMDAKTVFEGLYGMSRLAGMQVGVDEFQNMATMSNRVAAFGPLATRILGPSFVDQLAGYRGSSAVMTDQMFHGGRFRIDPVTGQTGLTSESLTSLHSELFQDLVGETGARRLGMRAGEVGMLFSELSQLGMAGGGLGRERREELLLGASRNMGLTPGRDVSELTPEIMQKLQADPAVTAALRGFDADQIKRNLKDYSRAVTAMSEIFSASGRGEGTIPELINALQQLTAGALTQFNPGDVELMARTTYQLARNTGLGLEGAMLLSQAAVQQAQSMGLPPVFATETLQGALGFRAAFQGLGMGSFPAWGLSGINEQTMADMQLRTAAAQSRAANQAGTALRIQESAGGPGAFRAGSAAASYLEAIHRGVTTFVDPRTGQTQSINMEQADFAAMLQEGSTFGLDQATTNRFLQQQATNLEFVHKAGLTHTVRMAQREEFFQHMADRAAWNAQGALGAAGLGADASRRLGAGVSRAAVDAMMEMTPEERSDRATRLDLMGKAIQQQLAGSSDPEAAQLRRRLEANPELLGTLSEEIWGGAEEFSRDPMNRFGARSLQDNLVQFDRRAMERVEHERQRAAAQVMQQQALAPLRGTGAFSEAVQAVIAAKPDDNLLTVLTRALGGRSREEIAQALLAPQEGDDQSTSLIGRLRSRAQEYQQAADAYESAADPEEKAKLFNPLQEAADAYRHAVEGVTKRGAEMGGFTVAESGGHSGREILAADAARREGKPADQWTDEELKRYYGEEQYNELLKSMDAPDSRRFHRDMFEDMLQTEGKRIDPLKYLELWQDVQQGSAGDRTYEFKIKIAELTLYEDGSAEMGGQGQGEPPTESGRQ